MIFFTQIIHTFNHDNYSIVRGVTYTQWGVSPIHSEGCQVPIHSEDCQVPIHSEGCHLYTVRVVPYTQWGLSPIHSEGCHLYNESCQVPIYSEGCHLYTVMVVRYLYTVRVVTYTQWGVSPIHSEGCHLYTVRVVPYTQWGVSPIHSEECHLYSESCPPLVIKHEFYDVATNKNKYNVKCWSTSKFRSGHQDVHRLKCSLERHSCIVMSQLHNCCDVIISTTQTKYYVVLLCPSRKGLQKMLYICEIFGDEYQISFNDNDNRIHQNHVGVYSLVTVFSKADCMLINPILIGLYYLSFLLSLWV